MTSLPQEELQRTFLVDLMKPLCKEVISFSTKVSNYALLEPCGPQFYVVVELWHMYIKNSAGLG